MTNSKDLLLLLLVTFITVVFIMPEDSIVRGLDRSYMLAGLIFIVLIALTHYSKIAVVLAVLIAAMGANLPEGIALMLNVDVRIFMGTLIAIVVVAMAKQMWKLPTGLEKPQGFATAGASVNVNRNVVELNVPTDDAGASDRTENNFPEIDTELKSSTSG